jgi:hypothetical protein
MWFIMLVLSAYLGRVLPAAVGVPSHPLFFIPRVVRRVLCGACGGCGGGGDLSQTFDRNNLYGMRACVYAYARV